MRVRRQAFLAALVVAIACATPLPVAAQPANSNDQPAVKLDDSEARIWEHRLGPYTAVHVSKSEAARLEFESYVSFAIVVSPDGRVESATPIEDTKGHLEDARAIEMARTFKPWTRDGRNIRVSVVDYVMLLPPELWAPAPAAFPEPWDLKSVEINLTRSMCYGRCPEYTLKIHGDGSVHFSGRHYVAATGDHEAQVSPGAVKELVQKFEQAHFFAAADRYAASVTDNPTYTLTLIVGGKKKTVTDYVGTQAGMPLVITDLENAVDELADTKRWIKGDESSAASGNEK
jgi:hypothetical protein